MTRADMIDEAVRGAMTPAAMRLFAEDATERGARFVGNHWPKVLRWIRTEFRRICEEQTA